MAFPFFTIFILFIAWFTFNRHRIEKRDKETERKYWDKEAEANSTRRKDISLLPYVRIPLDQLPFGIHPGDDILLQCEERIRTLSETKALNLTGKTNTELKLEYGAPNLPFLTECDQNFTELVRTMQQWGSRLYELCLTDEAEYVLSLAIRWGSDIKGSYILLARIYQEKKNLDGLSFLKEQAKQLNSLMKEPILTALEQIS